VLGIGGEGEDRMGINFCASTYYWEGGHVEYIEFIGRIVNNVG